MVGGEEWVVSVGCNGEEWEMVDGEECGWWWRGGWDERNGRVWEEGVVGGLSIGGKNRYRKIWLILPYLGKEGKR